MDLVSYLKLQIAELEKEALRIEGVVRGFRQLVDTLEAVEAQSAVKE